LTVWTWLEKQKIIGIHLAGSSLKFMMDAFQNVLLCSAEQHAVTGRWYGNTGMMFIATFTLLFTKLMTKLFMMWHKIFRNFLFGQSWISGRRQTTHHGVFDLAAFAF
jgi:hypothetical protein